MLRPNESIDIPIIFTADVRKYDEIINLNLMVSHMNVT